ncbi:hypothetical protein [Roseicella aquatilis]|uniref:SH3 domain-containing protein n=1 Tax=Roseicella aquatilis TaxID=2527868 RepID=A0A4V6P649_9PROT|nr:hypothetical protein [Roseicella aquatilis]TCZ66560.1 hypothetical protein EXY23_00120 [Roseicella aquatilis]
MSRTACNGLVLGAALLALAACAEKPQPVAGSRVYYVDTQGAASVCNAPKALTLTTGQQTEATMAVKNDGGWCGISVVRSGRPFDAGLLVVRPQNGRVHVHTVGDATRIDYTPDAGFAGQDVFAVRMLPGNPALRVAVTVEPGAVVAPPAAPVAPAAKPAAKAAPTRKAPAKKK